MADSIPTKDVENLTGATYRQLDYWCRRGMIPGLEAGPGSGFGRLWSSEAVEAAQLLALTLKTFVPKGKVDVPTLADFVRRAAEAGVKP